LNERNIYGDIIEYYVATYQLISFDLPSKKV